MVANDGQIVGDDGQEQQFLRIIRITTWAPGHRWPSGLPTGSLAQGSEEVEGKLTHLAVEIMSSKH